MSDLFDTEWQGDDELVVRLHSEINGFMEQDLLDGLAVEANKVRELKTPRVCVDFAALPFFGSIVIEGVCLLWRALEDHGGQMRIVNVSPVGYEVLKVSRFDTVWDIAQAE